MVLVYCENTADQFTALCIYYDVVVVLIEKGGVSQISIQTNTHTTKLHVRRYVTVTVAVAVTLLSYFLVVINAPLVVGLNVVVVPYRTRYQGRCVGYQS